MKCEFCDKEFSNKYILHNHQKTTKYCLDIQSKLLETKYNCKYCKKNFTTEQRVISHSQICKNKLINIEELVKNNNEILYKNKELEKELLEKNNKIKELEDKLYKILEKSVDKPTTTTNNNYIEKIEKLEIISPSFLNEQAQYLTIDHIKNGAQGYSNFFLEHQLKDRVICTDFSRRKIKYKDENGDVITDPEMNSLSILLFSSIKDRNQELTERYMDELLSKETNISFFMKISRNLEKQDIEFRNMLNGEKSGMYNDIIRTLCSRIK